MSTHTELPTVNFDSFPGYDEFSFLHSTYSSEFKSRSLISSRMGIVDQNYDPASAPFTTGRPLLVSVSPINPLTIDITAGYAITPSNLLINIDASVPSVTLPDIASGNTYVVAVEYILVASPQTRVNRYGELTEVRLERPANIPPGGGASTLMNTITVVNINDYYDTSLFTDDRKKNIVVIAVVSVQSDAVTGQLSLAVDLTRNSYSFNRPWFTIIDIEHRSKIGSGLITDNNPHGVDLQDLSSAGLTLYQQIKPRGGVLAKDATYYGYAGKLCSELIEVSRWEVDMSGTATAQPGQPIVGGRYFIRLSKLPVRMGSLYVTGKPWEPIPYDWIAGTRLLILGTLENPLNFSDSLIIEYFTVDALEINAEDPLAGLQLVEVKSPASAQEFIISGGLAVSTLVQTTMSLPSLLGPIKKGYHLICDSLGALALNPQPLVASMKVADLVGTTQTVNQSPLNGTATFLMIGLTGATDSSISNNTTYSLDLRLMLTGLDANGAVIQETITFKASQWRDQSQANVEEPLQSLRTMNRYQILNSISLANTLNEPHNAGAKAIISVWSDIFDASTNQEFASVASFFWTGTTGIQVKDERLISTSFDKLDQKQKRFPCEAPDSNITAVQEFLSVLLTPPLSSPETPVKRLMLELDDDRNYSETWKEFSTASAAGSIALANVSLVTVGTTIRVATGKVMRIIPMVDTTDDNTKEATKAKTYLGEVNFDPTDAVFRNNLITTINDPSWDSTWYASKGSGSTPPILMSRADAYPEGFTTCIRKSVQFTNSSTSQGLLPGDKIEFTIGAIEFTGANGISYTGDNDTTLLALCTAVNAVSEDTGGIFASIKIARDQNGNESRPYNTVMFHGNSEGDDFYLSNFTVTSFPASVIPILAQGFTFTQPSGGKLPTPHLPQRYPSALKPWVYLSRAFSWEGVSLEATLQVRVNPLTLYADPTYIGNLDAIEIAPQRTIKARAGSGASANQTVGEFLVDTTSIFNTFTNLVNTVNDPTFATGIKADIPGVAQGVLPSASLGDTSVTDPNAQFTSDLFGHFFLIDGQFIGSDRPLVLRISGVPSITELEFDPTYIMTEIPLDLMSVPYTILAPKVRLRSGGMASNSLKVISEMTSGTWILTSARGVTKYLPQGPGRGNGFIKSAKPLASCEWRYKTVEDLALGWSKWEIMRPISPTAFTLAAPYGYSLYEIQLKLQSAETNSFALYSYVPEISGATMESLQTRVNILSNQVADLEGQMATVLPAITAVTGELTDAKTSVSYTPDPASLKERLDILDSRLYLTAGAPMDPMGGFRLQSLVNGMSGVPPQLLGGPADGIFITNSGTILQVGSVSTPLSAQLGGFYYQYTRVVPLNFQTLGVLTGTYYIYLEKSTDWGYQVSSGTLTSVAGDSTSVTGSFPIVATPTQPAVLAGHLFYTEHPDLLVGGQPLVMTITAATATLLSFSGRLPADASSVSYKIYAPREGNIGYSTTKTDKTKLYIGEVGWSTITNTFSNIRSYRYLDKYNSDLDLPSKVLVNASTGSFEQPFTHNLGKIPSSFTLYFYEETDTTFSNPKVLHVGDEVVVKVTPNTLTVRNRYANMVARNYDGAARDKGYLHLVI